MKDDQGVIASLTGIATVSEAGALLDQLANLSSEPSLLVIQAGDALTTCIPHFKHWLARWPFVQILGFDLGQHAAQIHAFFDAGGSDLVPTELVGSAALKTYWQAKIQLVETQIRLLKMAARKTLQPVAEEPLAEPSLVEDLALGAQVQKQLMPSQPLTVGNLVIDHEVQSRLPLSGDFVQYTRIGAHEVLALFADVSGHGAGSALVTVLLHEHFWDFARELMDEDPAGLSVLLERLNRRLCSAAFEHHATCVLALVNLRDSTLQYCAAGHFPHPILVQNGEITVLESSDLPLGLLESKEYDAQQLELAAEFKLLLFSDGALGDLPGNSVAKQEAELASFVKSDSGKIEGLFDRLFKVSDDRLADDRSVLSLVRKV